MSKQDVTPPCLNCQLITSDGQCLRVWPENTENGKIFNRIKVKAMKETVDGVEVDMVPAYHVWRYYSDKQCFIAKFTGGFESGSIKVVSK